MLLVPPLCAWSACSARTEQGWYKLQETLTNNDTLCCILHQKR